MRVDRRFSIVVVISLVWALLVSALFYRVASGSRRSSHQGRKATVIAAQPLPFGAVIKPEFIKVAELPDSLFPNGGFSKLDEVVGRPVISPIQPGEPVVEARLAARGSGGGLSPLIPLGMRAISVRVNDVVGVAGFVLPGMRVDVLVTGSPPGREDTMTTTVLQNITVLSVGQTIQVDAKSQAINAPVVTLLVKPEQAEALTLANNQGHIQLVLRNATDQAVAPTSGRQLRELYGQAPRESKAPEQPKRPRPSQPAELVQVQAPAIPTAEPPADGVLVIRGNQKVMESWGAK
jgi:pilus assembly protein CpaB